MQDRQGKELQKIEEIQRAQFVEFTNAWDMYMENYENAMDIPRKNYHVVRIVVK